MRNRKIIAGVLASLVLFALVAAGSWTKSTMPNADGAVVRVGSKDFTESLILAEIYALALEEEGYRVERTFQISSSVVHTSLVNDAIDLYPEYTGTGLLSILGKKPLTDPQSVYDTVKKDYADRFHVTWLDYAEATDGQGLVIRTDVAERLNIRTISDLQAHATELRFASQGEFDERADGLKGLEKVYGPFDWVSSTVYDNSLKYSVLENNEADVTPAYTTDGQLVHKEKFTLLEDDRHCWPPYNIAPVVRTSFLEQHSDVADILNHISKQLTTDNVTAMNAKVDVDGKDYQVVAKAFYEQMKQQGEVNNE